MVLREIEVDEKYDELRIRLEQERDRLRRELAQIKERSKALGQDLGDVGTGYGNHMADDASETFELEKDLSLEQNLQQHLEEIEHALRKFENGTYGICESCGRRIAIERLEALPHTNLCIECKSRQESGKNERNRR